MSPLGLCAVTVRDYFCDGDSAVLLRADVNARIYPAFAVLGVGGPTRTEQLYTRWVQRLATSENADELVVLAVTLELPVRVVVIPHTPGHAASSGTSASLYQALPALARASLCDALLGC